MMDPVGTQKEGAFEIKLHPVAVLFTAVTVTLRGRCSEVCGEWPGAWALQPGRLGSRATSHLGPLQVV